MAQTVRCPNCNANLPLDPTSPTLHCDYCKSDVLNPAHADARERDDGGGGGGRGTILVAALVVALLGGGLAAYFVARSTRAPTPTPTAGRSAAGKAETPRPPRPSGPRVSSVLGVRDVDGDGVADLLFGGFCTAQAGGDLYRCSVGLLDGQSGKLRWVKRYLTTTGARGSRMLCHDVLVVQDNTRSIVGYDAASGAQRFRLALSDFFRYRGRVAGNAAHPICLFATEDRALSAVDVKAGKLLWRRDGRSPWGLRDVQTGDDSVLLGDGPQLLDLVSGAPRKTTLQTSRRLPPFRRPKLALAGTTLYRRPPRSTRITAYRTRDGQKLGQLDPGREGRFGLYPVGGQVLLLDAFKPPSRLALLDGARLVGPLVVAPDEAIAQARRVGETILLVTVNTAGTQRSTLRAFPVALGRERWNAQLDASGKSFKFGSSGPNFGGLGARSSGSALLAASPSTLFIELPPEQGQARLVARALADGKVLGELRWPAASHGGLRGIHPGPKRVYVRDNDDMIVALDPATRKVAWQRRWR